MKHINYGLSKFSPNPLSNYIKDLFKGLVRSTGNYPKSIWYSLRYNSGEKFLLYNPYNYPYQYDTALEAMQLKEPARLSTQLLTSIKTLQLIEHTKNNTITENSFSQLFDSSSSQKLLKNFNDSFYELYKSFEYNVDNKQFDVPVAVAARTLYAVNFYDHFNKSEEKLVINHLVLKFIMQKFLEKVEFADADSISQVLHSMAYKNYYRPEDWNTITKQLANKYFDVEFTHVKSNFPKYFSYRELDENDRNLPELEQKENDLYIKNYSSVFEAYLAIRKAADNGKGFINTEILSQLENRIPQLKYANLAL